MYLSTSTVLDPNPGVHAYSLLSFSPSLSFSLHPPPPFFLSPPLSLFLSPSSLSPFFFLSFTLYLTLSLFYFPSLPHAPTLYTPLSLLPSLIPSFPPFFSPSVPPSIPSSKVPMHLEHYPICTRAFSLT